MKTSSDAPTAEYFARVEEKSRTFRDVSAGGDLAIDMLHRAYLSDLEALRTRHNEERRALWDRYQRDLFVKGFGAHVVDKYDVLDAALDVGGKTP